MLIRYDNILKTIFTIIPATTSSTTIPAPPAIRRSRVRMGTGLAMSSMRNRTKPKTPFATVNGRPIRATASPQTSSMTITPGSFCCNSCSAWPAIQTDEPTSAANMTKAPTSGSWASIQHRGRPTRLPKVPGAKGMYPKPHALERNRIAFLRIVMARLYSLDLVLSRIGLAFWVAATADW